MVVRDHSCSDARVTGNGMAEAEADGMGRQAILVIG